MFPKQNYWNLSTLQINHIIAATELVELGFKDTSTLVSHLCCLPEKGRRPLEEIVEEMKERDRGEGKMNDSEETEEIKTFPLYPYLLQG